MHKVFKHMLLILNIKRGLMYNTIRKYIMVGNPLREKSKIRTKLGSTKWHNEFYLVTL